MFTPTQTLTMHNAGATLAEGLRAVNGGQTAIDLAQLTVVDSAAVATLLAWRRAALAQGTSLSFQHVPPNLQSLIDLYGVSELLPS